MIKSVDFCDMNIKFTVASNGRTIKQADDGEVYIRNNDLILMTNVHYCYKYSIDDLKEVLQLKQSGGVLLKLKERDVIIKCADEYRSDELFNFLAGIVYHLRKSNEK